MIINKRRRGGETPPERLAGQEALQFSKTATVAAGQQ